MKNSKMVYGERRSEKRTVSRLVIMGEKVSKVVRCLGRAKRVWSRVRAAVWALLGGRDRALVRLRWAWGTGNRGRLFCFAG
jgi:hypothetical protein